MKIMSDIEYVEKIEFIYDNTDVYGEYINFTFVIGNNRIVFGDNEWDDEIPSFAVLYHKVMQREDFSLCLEKNSVNYHRFRVTNLEGDKVLLFVDIIGRAAGICEFKRKALLKMLRKPLLKAAKDKDYLRVKFDGWDIETDPEAAAEHDGYIRMLEHQIVPDFIWKEMQDYNLDDPRNIFRS